MVPYLLGTSAVKYSLRPTEPASAQVPRGASADYLREELKSRLAAKGATFDFLMQVRTDPATMPIEDPTVRWSAQRAPFHKVATLELLPEDFDTPERRTLGENLSFNPWRCLPEHRPLGGISRARRQIYRALSSFRHDRNTAPVDEPTGFP